MAPLKRLTALATTALLTSVATPAFAATPEAPVLVSPANGSVSSSSNLSLAVTASDLDGGTLQLRFEGRKKGATVSNAQPFTLVVLPDTQNYTYSGRQWTINAQTQWVLDTRSSFNTAMVVHLGDLVSNYDNVTQWGHASAGMKVLDDAAMPNTVTPGNHDFNNASGAFTEYDTYFPPTRYLSKTWTPSTASYGGYLGQNLFGTDPVDRRNMDNFALFSAGGTDFLVLNLEWEAPQYALDWGTKVLAAYPDRTAILVTHSFLQLSGGRNTTAQRPGGTSQTKLWTDFVAKQCSIRLVLSGHVHDGDLGEANRSDLNSCGEPVQQIMSDYQDRANGGNGWLRYYRFDPAAQTITTTTYSPTLNQYETDANSSFTVPFELSATEPAPFQEIGSTTVASGGTATQTWTGLDADTEYEWRAVAGDGTDSTTSEVWTVRTPASTTLVDDTFTRITSNGWGAADATHGWTVKGSTSVYSVDGEAAKVVDPVGSTRGGTLTGLSVSEAQYTLDLANAGTASGSGTYVTLATRSAGGNAYRAKARYVATGGINLELSRVVGSSEVSLGATSSGITATAGLKLRLRLELEGTSPTRLRLKLWPAAGTEPATWKLSATDATAALQTPGTAGVEVYTSGTATGASTLSFDRFTVTALGAVTPPANQPPKARIATPTINDLTVNVDATGSTDTDGNITKYEWDFGDNTTGTGATSSHTYITAGTYTVTLKVTDDDNATDTTTTQVGVTPPTGPVAADGFSRTVSNGWGSADKGGSWSLTGAANRYSIAGDVGRQTLTTLGSSATSTLAGVTATSLDLRANLAWSRTSSAGTLYASLIPRRVNSNSDYRCSVLVATSGAIQLQLVTGVSGVQTTLATKKVPGLTQTAGTQYRVSCLAALQGDGTQLAAKLWPVGTTEPTDWLLSAVDKSPALQVAGSPAVSSYLSSGATQPATLSVDLLEATQP